MITQPRKIHFLLILCLCFTAALFAREQTRALWVTRWDYKSTDDIRKIITNAVSLKFNVILFQVRGAGMALYHSEIEPRSELLREAPNSWDPLLTAITLAHQAGLELHAWVNLYPAWNKDVLPLDEKHLYYQHPNWFMHDIYGGHSKLKNGYQWLAPTHPDVPRYLLDVCAEIYENYNVDGLHLDYIRFPAQTYSYDPASVRVFRQKFGAAPQSRPRAWRLWRQNSISRLLDSLYADVKKIKPDLVVSAAVVANFDLARKIYFQDGPGWLARGSMDAIYPMLYTNDVAIFERRLQDFLDNTHNRHIYAGINLKNDHLDGKFEIIDRLGAAGVGIFSYKEISKEHVIDQDIRSRLESIWPDAIPPASMPWKGSPKDNQGPLITQVQSVPSPLPPNSQFKIAARIVDPSGIFEKRTESGEYGVYLETDDGRIRMQRIKKSSHWFITRGALPGKELGSVFQGSIIAHDNAHISAGRPRRNIGVSDLFTLPVVRPESSFLFEQEVGPILRQPGNLAVDDLGRIWVTTETPGEGPVIIMDSTGRALDFSPLKTGINGFFESLWLDRVVDFARGPHNTMLVACNTQPPMIFRFDAETGDPLPGIEVSFAMNGIATDANGNIYVLSRNDTRWVLLSETGGELNGSPYGGGGNGGDIAVLSNGAAVFIADARANVIQTWYGAVEGQYSTYWPGNDLQSSDLGAGDIFVAAGDRVFVASARFGHIAITNRAGQPLGHIIDDKHINAPRAVALSPDRRLLYHIEVVGDGPTKVRRWRKKD